MRGREGVCGDWGGGGAKFFFFGAEIPTKFMIEGYFEGGWIEFGPPRCPLAAQVFSCAPWLPRLSKTAASWCCFQERKGHINFREIPATPAGCVPGTPGGANRGLPACVPGISCSTIFLRILFSFFCPVHPTLPQAISFPKILSFWDLRCTLSSREKATSRGWVLGDGPGRGCPTGKKGRSFFYGA